MSLNPEVVITSQPIKDPVVLDSDNHELISKHNENDTVLDPSVPSLEQQEELKQKAKEESILCCEAIADCFELCIDFICCSAHCTDPCCSGDCCNDGCCNDGCCNNDGCNNDGSNNDGCDPSCFEACCGCDDCCGD